MEPVNAPPPIARVPSSISARSPACLRKPLLQLPSFSAPDRLVLRGMGGNSEWLELAS
jgi:hypothetical protein